MRFHVQSIRLFRTLFCRDDTNVVSTYYVLLIDSYTALIVVCDGKKTRADKAVVDFVQGNKIFGVLRFY